MAQIIKKINMALSIAFGSEKHSLKIGAAEIQCYILEDGQYVFLKNSLQKALGYEGKSDSWLPGILNSIEKFSLLPAGLMERYYHTIPFEIRRIDGLKYIFEGLSPKTFLEICKVISDAKKDGYLNLSQLKYSKAAEAVLDHLNEKNSNDLIDLATGFKFYKQSAIEHLQQFLSENLQDPAFVWIKTFPEPLFCAIFEAHGLDWASLNEKPQRIGRIIYDIIFSRIPNDLLSELRFRKPKRVYQQKNNKTQDIQYPELKEYVVSILSLLKASGNSWNIFLQLLNRTHPKNPAFTTKFPIFSENAFQNEALSDFNQSLKKMS
jgi:hypothetical protein